MPGSRTEGHRPRLIRRYTLLLLAAAAIPMLVVGVLYDRYARSLLDQFAGEQLDAQLAATASRLGAFLEERSYQLDALARYPTLGAGSPPAGRAGDELGSLLRILADGPDLYGILFFSEQGPLVRAVAGASASGAPYWSELPFDVARLPRRPFRDAEMVGPVPPQGGHSGWFLLEEPLHRGGRVALHVRLASLTELLGSTSLAGVVQPILRTPAGDFDAVGRATTVSGRVAEGPEVAPGWRPALVVDSAELVRPFEAGRAALLVASLVVLATIVAVSVQLTGSLRSRVDALARGAEAVARGDFTHRVEASADDELGMLGVAFNRMSARLADLVEQAVRMERLAVLGTFSTGVAHEVRNPLATLKTTVQALARGEKDPERRALLGHMEQEVDRMARAMEDLLAFGRPQPPKRSEVQVREVARRLATLAAGEADRRAVELRLKVDPSLRAVVDPDHLLQILMNLTLNALQATPAGKAITLDAHAAGDRVVLEVSDEGPGISPESLRRVFEPFFTTSPGGTGLGLSISRQLAEMNGGSLSLESQPGAGTTARVTLLRSEDPR